MVSKSSGIHIPITASWNDLLSNVYPFAARVRKGGFDDCRRVDGAINAIIA
jgi:hypothetical protein